MDLPKYHETFIPMLQVLHDKGRLHYSELGRLVRDIYYSNLSSELLSKKTKSGDVLILNRIAWGKSYLKQGNFVEYPERGMVQITSKGEQALKRGSLTRRDLQNDSDWLAYKEAKKAEKIDEDSINIENESPQDLIDSGFVSMEVQTKSELLDRLKSLDPYYFQKVILILLKKMGYGDFIETPKSGDGGIDGIINQDQLGVEKIYIQAKRYDESKVREKDIRNFIGAMSGDTSKGVFVTSSNFDDAAVKKANEANHSIILIDGNKLADLMFQFNVGVQVRSTYEVKQVDEDFFEAS
ncbi:restriction endonuclease [Candidatus Peribacteria bacterium RIFCSPLOWO2_01_FULL_53_10]|nr:MAG: restriction endonuclease [Candidatus Peribacteria bacterium RIFCSPLOWO2_01_FULL_53_10]